MKKFAKLFGIIALVAAIGFSFAGCDDGNNNNNNNNNNNGGGNCVVTIQNTTSPVVLAVHDFTPRKSQGTSQGGQVTYTVAKNASVTMQIRKGGSGYNTLEASDFDVRFLDAATAFTGTGKDVTYGNNQYYVLEYTFTVTQDITLVISNAVP